LVSKLDKNAVRMDFVRAVARVSAAKPGVSLLCK
jgi:hypothetical protein